MNLNEANLDNLTRLWQRYGAVQMAGNNQVQLFCHTHWPHRCWIEGEVHEAADVAALLDAIPDTATVSLWPMGGVEADIDQQLTQQGWRVAMLQTAMVLPLTTPYIRALSSEAAFGMHQVHTLESVEEWVAICSDAFGYPIDVRVIESLIKDPDVRVLLGSVEGQAAASALLYKTGDVIGVHQLGVSRAFQGKGVARQFMHELLMASAKWQGKQVVLQASEAGLRLYEGLGFEKQFVIKNYKAVI